MPPPPRYSSNVHLPIADISEPDLSSLTMSSKSDANLQKLVKDTVYSFMLDTLHRVLHIERMSRFLKMIGIIDKEDCAINLRYKMFISV